MKEPSQLSEEHLFELLINKVKMREKKEAAELKGKMHMESLVMYLTEENKNLKEDLKIRTADLQRRGTELNSLRSQMQTWKSKLTKFRGYLNEFGADYKVLRGEAIQLKASRTHLDREKKEIEGTIASANKHISQVSNLLSERRSHVSKTVHATELLKQFLTSTEDRMKVVQDQLFHERKRSSTLESYIQQQTLAQGIRLSLIVSNQVSIMTALDSRFVKIGSQLESIKSNVQSIIDNALDQCLLSLKQLDKNHSAGMIDVRRVEEFIKEFTAR